MIDFNELYTKNIPSLSRYAMSFVSNEAAAKDIAVEMLYKCWERQNLFKNDEEALVYTKVLIKNKCINYIKHIQTRISWFGNIEDKQISHPVDFQNPVSSDISKIINVALSSLPKKTMQIFTLSKIDKVPQKDISEMLGLSLKAVEYHISQAKRALKEALKEYM